MPAPKALRVVDASRVQKGEVYVDTTKITGKIPNPVVKVLIHMIQRKLADSGYINFTVRVEAVPEGFNATEDRSGGVSVRWNERSRFRGVVMVIQSPDASETHDFTLALTRTGFAAIMPPPQKLFVTFYAYAKSRSTKKPAQVGYGQPQAQGYPVQGQYPQAQIQGNPQQQIQAQYQIDQPQAYDQYGATTDRYYQSAPVPTLAARPSQQVAQAGPRRAPMPPNRAAQRPNDSPRDYETSQNMPPGKTLKPQKSGWFGKSTPSGSEDPKRQAKANKDALKAQEKEWAAQKKAGKKNGWPNGAYAVPNSQTQQRPGLNRETSAFSDDEKPQKRGLFSKSR